MPKKGKKSAASGMTKSQLKKLERKRQLEQEQALRARVQTANIDEATGAARNVLADFVPFQGFSRNGLDATLEFHTASSMGKANLDWVCDLTARNMMALYEASDRMATNSNDASAVRATHLASSSPAKLPAALA